MTASLKKELEQRGAIFQRDFGLRKSWLTSIRRSHNPNVDGQNQGSAQLVKGGFAYILLLRTS